MQIKTREPMWQGARQAWSAFGAAMRHACGKQQARSGIQDLYVKSAQPLPTVAKIPIRPLWDFNFLVHYRQQPREPMTNTERKRLPNIAARQGVLPFLASLVLCIPPFAIATETPSNQTSVVPALPTMLSVTPSVEATLDLAALKGHVVYLDFWASWCGPCKQSFPWMKDAHQKYGDRGLVVVAVNLDKDRALADGFLREFRPRFPVVYDKEGKLAQQFNIKAMPYSLIIDRDGKTQFVHSGFSNDQRQKLDSELLSLLN